MVHEEHRRDAEATVDPDSSLDTVEDEQSRQLVVVVVVLVIASKHECLVAFLNHSGIASYAGFVGYHGSKPDLVEDSSEPRSGR